jgi:uncharacterized protein (TIGR02118 family)
MSVTLQVLYPISNGSTFDFDYYTATHFPLVGEHMGPHIEAISASKGLAGGPDTPPAFHAVATLTFADMDKMQAALAVAGPVLADIPNFTNSAPQMLIGEVLG